MKINNLLKIVYNEEEIIDIECRDQYHPPGTKYLFIFKNLCYNKN